MTDLWDPVKRTLLCGSCHIGSEGNEKMGEPRRFVTHEMYAAGHPPLPGFEVATFSNEMPRHWDYLREKDAEVLKAQNLDQKSFQYEQTQLVLTGAAASLAEQMRLLVGQSDGLKKDEQLDLSNFDCYACHHGLVGDAWRQKRGYGGLRPGRLPMRPWTTELIRLAVQYVEPTDDGRKKRLADFDAKLKAVKEGFTSRMYGNPKAIGKAANDLAGWASTLAGDVQKKAHNSPAMEKDSRALYDAIPKLFYAKDPKEWVDYDSARQVGWGFKVMYYEAKKLDWFKPDEKDPVVGQLNKLDKELKLRLPTAPKSIDNELDETLKALNDYKPATFNELLKGLGEKLDSK
jgi:hypothetical protein